MRTEEEVPLESFRTGELGLSFLAYKRLNQLKDDFLKVLSILAGSVEMTKCS